jgi:hypothetical protein
LKVFNKQVIRKAFDFEREKGTRRQKINVTKRIFII